jgi:hypothetical protein
MSTRPAPEGLEDVTLLDGIVRSIGFGMVDQVVYILAEHFSAADIRSTAEKPDCKTYRCASNPNRRLPRGRIEQKRK